MYIIHSPRKGNIKGEAELRGTYPKRLENSTYRTKKFQVFRN